jgi:hypothetical protein
MRPAVGCTDTVVLVRVTDRVAATAAAASQPADRGDFTDTEAVPRRRAAERIDGADLLDATDEALSLSHVHLQRAAAAAAIALRNRNQHGCAFFDSEGRLRLRPAVIVIA